MTATLDCQVVTDQADFAECLAIRIEVFVREQGVPEDEELDELDSVAIHALARLGGVAVGTGRLVLVSNRGRIGRMAVRKEYRGRGVGSTVLRRLVGVARENDLAEVYLAAQLHAIPFYERFGFRAEGEIFADATIPHRWMYLRMSAAASGAAPSANSGVPHGDGSLTSGAAPRANSGFPMVTGR